MIKKDLPGSISIQELTVAVTKGKSCHADIYYLGQFGGILIQYCERTIIDLESFVGPS